MNRGRRRRGWGEGRAISPHVDAVALVRIEMCESEREREREGTISIETWQREMNNFQPGNRSQSIRTRFFSSLLKKNCNFCLM